MCNDANVDKVFRHAILDAEGALPEGYTAQQLTPALLGYLGVTDHEWRDEIAYPYLHHTMYYTEVQREPAYST
jgi:hypothetical protein